jgi:hypothetical protein
MEKVSNRRTRCDFGTNSICLGDTLQRVPSPRLQRAMFRKQAGLGGVGRGLYRIQSHLFVSKLGGLHWGKWKEGGRERECVQSAYRQYTLRAKI